MERIAGVMDNQRLDQILKQRLESYRDSGPADDGGMEEVFAVLDSRIKIPWYSGWKPYLVAAGVSIFMISSALAIWQFRRQDARIHQLENSISWLDKDSTGTDNTPLTNDNSNEENVTIEIMNGEDSSLSAPTKGKKSRNEGLVATPAEEPNEGETEKKLKTLGEVKHISGVPAMDFYQMNSMHGISGDLLANKNPEIADGLNIKLPVIQGGALVNFHVPHSDLGKGKAGLTAGLQSEILISRHVRVGAGLAVGKRQYVIRDPVRHIHRLHRFPGLPDLTENNVSEITVTNRLVELPVWVSVFPGKGEGKIRPFVSAGITTSLTTRQDFVYRRSERDFYPGFRNGNKSIAVRGILGQIGAEVKITDHAYAKIALYTEQPIERVGIERQQFQVIGLSGGLFFRGG